MFGEKYDAEQKEREKEKGREREDIKANTVK